MTADLSATKSSWSEWHKQLAEDEARQLKEGRAYQSAKVEELELQARFDQRRAEQTKQILAGLVAVAAGVFLFVGRDFTYWGQTAAYGIVWSLIAIAILSFPQRTVRDGVLTFFIWLFVAGVVLVMGGLALAVALYFLNALGWLPFALPFL